MNRPRQLWLSQLGNWGWGLLLLPLLLWPELRQVVAVGLPESWLASLAVVGWVWLFVCLGLILAASLWNQKGNRAAPR